ncbi:MAG: formylglycine-generating enzyme family protein [Thermoguttaceae bacterium]|jgi:formylglycine-generating enzyme required for sulfatase activity
MFRQVSTVALAVIVAVGSLAVATAQGPKKAGGKAKNPPKELSFDLGNGVKLEMVLIPAGSFMMGDEKGENWEKPVHKVSITKPFHLGKYEVTQEQWEAVMGDNPSHFKGASNPVEGISWRDCQAFLIKLDAKTGGQWGKFVLPTQAQWEYACRAGSTTKYCFGDDETKLGDYAWYGANSERKTHPVGEKKPNAWGLYDMHGNVWEWCQDRYGDYGAEAVTNPRGPTEGSDRVIRGGGWIGDAGLCHSADRRDEPPGDEYDHLGLRVALIPADK